jgi:HSP20 family protein
MRALTPWRASSELTAVHNEIDDLFARFFGGTDSWWARPFEGRMAPAVESFVRDDHLVIRVDLPGIDPKDVELSVEGNHLTIRGERKGRSEKNESDRLYREVSYGRFERTLALPAAIDAESVEATYRDGVLEVTMKAPKGLVSKKVPITVH